MDKSRAMAMTALGIILMLLFTVAAYFHAELESSVKLNGSLILSAALAVAVFLYFAIAERDRETENIKYQFLTIATHQFRTPLSAIKWLLGNLEREVTREEKMDAVNKIRVSLDKISETIDVLGGLAKFEKGLDYAFQETGIRDLVDATLAKFKPEFVQKKIQFSITTDHTVPSLYIDAKKIRFVIDVLIENAIDYSAEGGLIGVTVTKDERAVTIGVRDHGIGLEKDDLNKIFSQFYRTEDAARAAPNGLGLSLAMAKKIVEKHGGRMFAESAGLGAGSVFFVKLPIAKK